MIRVADSFSVSDVGRQRRHNEDSLFARAPLFAVADGMGGAQAGEVASRTAVEFFEQGLGNDGGTEERLATLVRAANARIHELSQTNADQAGMGTTMTAVYVGPEDVVIAHVGDSRCYRLRDGVLTRLTDDHSLVDELVRQGRLTPEEAYDHPQRSVILRALGPEANVEVDTLTHHARGGDVYLICSDGLTTMIHEERVGDVLRAASGLREAGMALIAEANAAGGRDNITVILFRLEEVGDVAGDGMQTTAVTPRAAPTTSIIDQPTVPARPIVRPDAGAGTALPNRPPATPEEPTIIPPRKGSGPSASATVTAPLRATQGAGGQLSGRMLAPGTLPRRPSHGFPGPAPAPVAREAAAADIPLVRPPPAPPGGGGRTLRPRMPPPAAAPPGRARRVLRRMRRLTPALLIVTCVIAILAAGGYVASTAVYFVATNDRGFVTIYSGLPYSLPGGIHLYSQYYVSAVPASTIAPARRHSLLDHQLRSQGDASDLVRRLERGQISGATPSR